MTGFIQISDTHIVNKGRLAYGKSDTAAGLKHAIESINRMLPKLGDVSLVVITGDLTDHGTQDEYAHFNELIGALELPFKAIPGNHDRRGPMRAAFAGAGWMPESGPIQWHHDAGPYAIIALDTLLEGAHHGELSDAGFAFLDTTLKALAGKPVVIATHHPWLASGIEAMDADNLRNGARLLDRLSAYPGAVRMTAGHVHRAVTGVVDGITCQIVPSTCHAVETDYRADTLPGLTLEPAAFTVFRWLDMPGAGLISNTVPIGDFAGPWSFEGEDG